MARYLTFLALTQDILVACNTYDYVIIGGGTAGLLVANRLSANPDITVAVIEAGDSAYNNLNVTAIPRTIAEFSPGIGTSVDWSYTSAPQKYTANRTLPYYAGKALGGTTTINGMTYLRAEKAQINAWEELGNEGWNWESMWHYYLAQERFQVPDDVQRQNGASYEDDVHGFKGEVDVGFTPYLTGQGAFELVSKTSEELGFPFNKDANSGHMRGSTTWPMMLNVTTKIREDAARAFYWSIADTRSNLHISLNTTATRILWDEGSSLASQPVASGIEVISSDGSIDTVFAAREVIVSAGTLKSSALLELSGIGNPAIIEPLGIKTVVSCPTVGSNLQDQPNIGIVYTSSTNWTGYGTFVTYLTASDLFGPDLPAIVEELQASMSTYAATIVADYGPGAARSEVQEQRLLKHQIDLIFNPNSTIPLAEILWIPYQTSIVAQFWNLLPLSRGSIHITSPNATALPSINPNFFQLPIDIYVQAAISVRIREFFTTAPLSQHVTSEVSPSFEAVPRNATWRDPAWQTWIKRSYASNSHPLSTCAMMSRALGGVVDAEGKVYGTCNVRVVDASIFPTQISGHLTASVYAVAGKIADAILKQL